MSIFPDSNSTRVGLPEAMSRIIAVLKQGKPMSIASISKETHVDRRTVSKVIDLLLDMQETLHSLEIQTNRMGRKFMIGFKERTAKAREILASTKAKVAKRRVKLPRRKRTA
jgi:DNA-binding MarR family transcriptional regulator